MPGNRVALALGSGSARGYAHIGVIEALRERGYEIVGILHGCLRHRTHYDEHKAWAHRQTNPDTQAA